MAGVKPLMLAMVAAGGACATGAEMVDPGPSFAIAQLIPRIESFRGHTVRACAPLLERVPETALWDLISPQAVGYHPARLRVIPCRGRVPRRDREGCVTGRIARDSGSVEPVAPDEVVEISSEMSNSTWYLHAQCRNATG